LLSCFDFCFSLALLLGQLVKLASGLDIAFAAFLLGLFLCGLRSGTASLIFFNRFELGFLSLASGLLLRSLASGFLLSGESCGLLLLGKLCLVRGGGAVKLGFAGSLELANEVVECGLDVNQLVLQLQASFVLLALLFLASSLLL